MTADFIGGFAILFLFVSILILNPLLMSARRQWALTSSELLLIFMMCLTACVIPSWGLMANLIPIISGFKYFESPQNRWAELISPHIRKYLVPQEVESVRMFFEGVPKGVSYPFSAWLLPLSFWFLFIFVFSFFSICIAVMLRKQWVERERLIFPVAILPLEMVKYKKNGKIPDLLRNPLFWFGFAIPFLLTLLSVLAYFFPFMPSIGLYKIFEIFRGTTTITFVLSWPILGFAYFVSSNIAFSLWFFHLVSKLQTGWTNVSGFSLPGHTEVFDGSSAMTTYQGAGAVILFFVFLIWLARRHLKDVFRKAVFNSNDVDDSGEILSYRVCFFGSIISIISLLLFWHLTGMPLSVSSVFLFYTLATFVVLNRVICQAGLGFARSQCNPVSFTSYVLPPDIIGNGGYVGLGLQYPWAGDIRTTVLTATQNSLKIQEDVKNYPKFIFISIIVSIIIAYTVSAYSHLANGFEIGGLNKMPWFFRSFPHVAGNFMASKITSPITSEIIRSRYFFTGMGAGIMGFLIFMTNRFLWWPLHYIGFPIADSLPIARGWFSIFLAWLIKTIVLKYGGVHVYKKLAPVFLGIIVGGVAGFGFLMIIIAVTGRLGEIGGIFGI